MELDEIRKDIDEIDAELIKLLCRRMDKSIEVANYKRTHETAVRDNSREARILSRVDELAQKNYAPYIKNIYQEIMAESRALQYETLK